MQLNSGLGQSQGLFVGIDVADRRGCALALLNASLQGVAAAWIDAKPEIEATAAAVREAILSMAGASRLTIGIDAPRMPLANPRTVRWTEKGWVSCADCTGRHCEIVVSTLRLANPQWTPMRDRAPRWMKLGFALFEYLDTLGQVFEVFPSASYRILEGSDSPRVSLNFRGFQRGPKDVLDAYVGAVTAAEFAQGRGCAVGGGDRLGSIVLPKPLPECDPRLLEWPAGM